jgi:hypothetical protein
MRAGMSSAEYVRWTALYRVEAEEARQERKKHERS